MIEENKNKYIHRENNTIRNKISCFEFVVLVLLLLFVVGVVVLINLLSFYVYTYTSYIHVGVESSFNFLNIFYKNVLIKNVANVILMLFIAISVLTN